MDNPNREATPQQKVPITSSSSQPLAFNQSPSGKNRIVLFIILILVLTTLLLFVPIPYYQSQNAQCKAGAVNCPTKGWHLGLSLWQSLNSSYTSGPPTEESYISTPSPTPINADPTANWKTYTNTKYGYVFKYPLELALEGPSGQAEEPDSKTFEVFAGDFHVKVFDPAHLNSEGKLSVNLEFKTFVDKIWRTNRDSKCNTDLSNLGDITVDGKLAYQFSVSGCYNDSFMGATIGEKKWKITFVESNGFKYRIITANSSSEKILSTFQFSN